MFEIEVEAKLTRPRISIVGKNVRATTWNIRQLKTYVYKMRGENTNIYNQFLWIDVANPSKEVMVAIGSLFDLHSLSLQRWLDEDQREAVLIYPNYYEVLIKNVDHQNDTDILEVKNTRITIKKKVIITFHSKNDIIFDKEFCHH